MRIGAGYIRASTDDQLEYSPESQLAKIREFAKREGYLIPDEYVYQDDAISGKTAAKRPAFVSMIASAKSDSPPFDCIFVWEFSRFARNREESVVYKNLLRKIGITVRSVKEPLPDGPWAGLIESIIEWMDEYYLINLAEEVRRGMREKASRGEAMGTAPYGYTVKNKTFAINEDAEIIRYIFREFAAGKGARALAQELGERGVRTRRGNWPDNRWVHYILTNPVYIGKIRWSTEGHANYDRHNYNGENVLLVDGKHPPIIDNELWDAVQQRLRGPAQEVKYARKTSGPFMLQGLVRCSACGGTLTRSAYNGLQCHRYAHGQCASSHYIAEHTANRSVIEGVEEILEKGAFVFTPRRETEKPPSRDWDKLIASEQRRLSRARSAYLDGVFSLEEYREVKQEIEDNISRLNASRAAESEQELAMPSHEAYAERVIEALRVVKSPEETTEAKNLALRSIIDKIVFHRDTGTFDFYFIA